MPSTPLLGSYGDNTGAGLMFRNRLINGDMRVDQRNLGASVTGPTAGYIYPVDRWNMYTSVTSKMTGQQVSTAPVGFTNSVLISSSAATTPAAGDEYELVQSIEGYNVADFLWGTSSAKTITISFWVRSTLTGTFSGFLYNAGATRSYIFNFTINAANTWEYKTVTVPGCPDGAWGAGANQGIKLGFDFGCGTNYEGTGSTWLSSFKTRTAGSTRLINTSGATMNITGVQLEAGVTATTFEFRPYHTELAMCQRYYYRCTWSNGPSTDNYLTFGLASTTNTVLFNFPHPVTMCAKPNLSISLTVANYNATVIDLASTVSAGAGDIYRFAGALTTANSILTAGTTYRLLLSQSGQFIEANSGL